jgi:2-keto-4-pentenoate hydratase
MVAGKCGVPEPSSGAGREWRGLDLAGDGAAVDQRPRNGSGVSAMSWATVECARLARWSSADGTPLRRGMIVMTGSMVPIQHPVAGNRVLVEVSGLGAAELVLT